MTTTPPTQPSRPRRALVGVACAAAVAGIGHGAAGLLAPAASPVVAVAQQAVFLAPQPVKELAVKYLGTADKPVLVSGVLVVLLVLAAGIGLLAWTRRRLAVGLVVGLGVVGLAAALAQQASIAAAVPSLLGTAVGVSALLWIVGGGGVGADRAPATDDHDGADAAPAPATPSGATTLRRPDRRTFLGAAGLAVLAVGGAGVGEVAQRRSGGSAFTLPRPVSPAAPIPAGVQAPGAAPFLTPVPDFYRVDVSLLTPQVDAEGWQLRIDGMVDRPMTLSYADLLKLPMIERTITLSCVSNEVGGPYVSTARWLGVPFTEIIKRVGVQPGVEQVFSYSSDSGYTCSTPFQAVSDGRDAMIVVGMDGLPLPAKNGFPARMLVPGLYGFVSGTKWLKRLEFTTYAQRTAYWTERKWATDAPILTQSRIDVPKPLGTVPADKPVLAGVAWAQHRGVEKVEIRIDDGDWQEARLAADAGVDLWRQWWFPYDGPPGRHRATVRATDGTGHTQTDERTPVFPRGATGWHTIAFEVA